MAFSRIPWALGAWFFGWFAAAPHATGAEALVFFGTYTGGKSRGIYVSRLDSATGRLSQPTLAAEAANPSFLALHPNGRFLYAVGELDKVEGRPGGAVSAFALDPVSGALTRLNQASSAGAHPCHLVVDATGRWVLLANYSGGNVAVLPIREDGSVGDPWQIAQHVGSSVNPRRQERPHAHSINLDAANRFAIAADLGTDKLMIYRFHPPTGSLEANDPAFATLPPGSGPRHFAFHPGGRHAFAINELLSTLTAFRYDARRGALETVATLSTLPPGFGGENTTAEVQVHPNGRYVYGSNRGDDSIAVFRFDRRRETLRWVERESTRGKTPRNFAIDPSGRWLLAANQNSDSVVVFRIDSRTGELSPAGSVIEVGAPVCVKFLATR